MLELDLPDTSDLTINGRIINKPERMKINKTISIEPKVMLTADVRINPVVDQWLI